MSPVVSAGWRIGMLMDVEASRALEAQHAAEQRELYELDAAVGPCATCGHRLLAHENDGCAVNHHEDAQGAECECVEFVAP